VHLHTQRLNVVGACSKEQRSSSRWLRICWRMSTLEDWCWPIPRRMQYA
jgi:hypothetical protein